MKKFSKTILAVAAVSAVSAAMAVSASAMSASYADGSVTLTDVNGTGDQQTILVLSDNAATVAESSIKQIDQKAGVFDVVPVGELATGTYYVRVGGSDGSLQTAEFTVGGSVTPDPETVAIIVGDVSGDDEVGGLDGVQIARYMADFTDNIGNTGAEYATPEGGKVVVGDVSGDDEVGGLDGVQIARYMADFTDNIGKTGQSVTIVKPE